MKVYVWQSYGSISVYAAETVDDLERLFSTVSCCLASWDIDNEITKLTELFNKGMLLSRRDMMLRAINDLADFGAGHESFEYNHFTTVEQP